MDRTINAEMAKSLLNRQIVKVLDVRRKNDFDADTHTLPGAIRSDPEKISEWSKTLHKDQPILIYCTRGGSVSNSVVDQLRNKGLDAGFIEGGIEGWKTSGGSIAPK